MAQQDTMTITEFAGYINRRQSYVSQLKKAGRLVLTNDGRRVRAAESLALINATRDSSKQGVADRHAATRQQSVEHRAPDMPGPAEDMRLAIGTSQQKSRAVKEHFAALEAKRVYEEAIGKLVAADQVAAAAASAFSDIRNRLMNTANALAPMLVSLSNEAEIRAVLLNEFEHLLESASRAFSALSKEKK